MEIIVKTKDGEIKIRSMKDHYIVTTDTDNFDFDKEQMMEMVMFLEDY